MAKKKKLNTDLKQTKEGKTRKKGRDLNKVIASEELGTTYKMGEFALDNGDTEEENALDPSVLGTDEDDVEGIYFGLDDTGADDPILDGALLDPDDDGKYYDS